MSRLRDTRSYEVQIIDAVRSVNKALGGTYGTSSAIHKSDFNQYEVQLIDAIRGIGRTLSSGNISLLGGGGGDVSSEAFMSLSARVTKLEQESFFRLVDGNVTLKPEYRNLWVPGWIGAGGVGTGSGGGGATNLRELDDVYHDLSSVLRANGSAVVAGDSLVYNSTLGWVAAAVSGGETYTAGTGISISAQNVISLSATTASAIGGVKVGSVITTPTIEEISSMENRYYYLQADSNGLAFVNIPWTGGGGGAYTLGTPTAATAAKGTMLGVNAVSNDLSSTGSESSLFEWDSTNSAWRFRGNLYADGWIAAGGVGTGSSGSVAHLEDIGDVVIDSTTLADGQGITWDATNMVWKNATIGSSYTLPIASSNTLGGIKVGTGLTIDNNGVLSATGGGGAVYIGSSAHATTVSDITLSGTISSGQVLYYAGGNTWTNAYVELSDVALPSSISSSSGYMYYSNVSGWALMPGTGGSTVSVTQRVSTGTKIATITVDGVGTDLYAPSGGSGVSLSDVWDSLTSSSGTYGSTKINASHIPDLSGTYVTLSTTQNNISGAKTFTTNPLTIASSSGIAVDGSSYIDIGNARLVYDSGTKALHITKKSGTSSTISLYADGFVAAGGVAGQTTSSYVDLESTQTIGGAKTFTSAMSLSSTLNINGVTLTGSSTKLSVSKNTEFSGISNVSGGKISIQDLLDRIIALEP